MEGSEQCQLLAAQKSIRSEVCLVRVGDVLLDDAGPIHPPENVSVMEVMMFKSLIKTTARGSKDLSINVVMRTVEKANSDVIMKL